MKSLADYVIEHIFEGSKMNSKPKDNWIHNGKYDYSKAIISILLKDDKDSYKYPYPTTLKNHDNPPSSVTMNDGKIVVTANDNQKEDLKNLYNNIEKNSFEDFDKIFAGTGVKWRKLDKYPYSTGSKSQSYSEAAEYLVTYFFNLGQDILQKIPSNKKDYNKKTNINDLLSELNKDNKDDIANNIKEAIKEWEDINSRDAIHDTTSPYMYSSVKSALLAYDLLNNEKSNLKINPNNYTAIQVNGKQLSKDSAIKNSDKLITIANYFSDGKFINNLIKGFVGGNYNTNECSKLLFNYGQKDNWNKADILLVNNNLLNLEKITNLFKDAFESFKKQNAAKIATDEPIEEALCKIYNDVLNEFIVNREIIPISLKLISSNNGKCTLERGFTDEEVNLDVLTVDDIKNDIRIIFPQSLEPGVSSGSLYLEADDAQGNIYGLQFRSQTGDTGYNNLTIQSYNKLKGKSGSMRMGKGIKAIKNKFSLKGNSYYISIDGMENMLNLTNKYFDIFGVGDAENKNSNSSKTTRDIKTLGNRLKEKLGNIDPKIWERTCVKGLFGLLNVMFYNKSKIFVVKKIKEISSNELKNAFHLLYSLCAYTDSKFKSHWWLIM